MILQYVVGKIDELPYEGLNMNASGNLVMTEATMNEPGIINIPVEISNGENIYSLLGSVGYDEEILEFQGLSKTQDTEAYILAHSKGENKLNIGGSGSEALNGSSKMMIMKFKLKDGVTAEETTLNLSGVRVNEGTEIQNAANFTIDIDEITNIGKSDKTPASFRLKQNYPNPFNPSTTISFEIPEASEVKIVIFNAVGAKVESEVMGYVQPGGYSYTWNAGSLSSGVYFYKVTAGKYSEIKKAILLK